MKYRTLENRVELQQYWLGLLVGVAVFFLMENIGLLGGVRALSEKSFQPFQRFGLGIVHLVEFPYRMILSSYNSSQKIQDLESRYGELAAIVGQQESLKIENEELRKIANATASSGGNSKILMPILGYSQPIIANTQHNVETGDPVFIEGVFVGQVGKLSQNQAQVNLLSQMFTQPILAKTAAGTTGLIYGTGKDIVLKEVPIEQQILVGQQVFTAGQDGVLPNWYVGRIQEVQRHEGSPTQDAVIDQGVSFFESKMVEIK